jgi:hypothetical protein
MDINENINEDIIFELSQYLTDGELDSMMMSLHTTKIVQQYWKHQLEKRYKIIFKDDFNISWRNLHKYVKGDPIGKVINRCIDDNKYTYLNTILKTGINCDACLKYAVENNKVQAVKIMMRYPQINPRFQNNYLIKSACADGYSEIVEILLKDPRTNPAAENNYCISWAARRANVDVVKLLLEDPRVYPCGKGPDDAIDRVNRRLSEITYRDKWKNYEIIAELLNRKCKK